MHGVLKCSILGPLLFSIHFNDLANTSKFITKLFADNTALPLHDDNLKTHNKSVNCELIKVANWLKINKLSINYNTQKHIIC